MTVSAAEVLQKDIPYLRAVQDYDTDCPSFTWEKKIQAATISRLLEQGGHKIGRLRGYRISDSEKPATKQRTGIPAAESKSFTGRETLAALP